MRQPQELNASSGMKCGERQEDRGGEDLPGLHALEGEAGEEAAPAERRVLEDHRTGAGDLAGDREALDEAQDDEQHRGEHADLLVGRQERRRPSSRSPSGTCTASSTVLRPWVSPQCPRTKAPIGRAT